MKLSGFRLGNYAQFDGELQRITTEVGLANAAFLEPVPITHSLFEELGYEIVRKTPFYTLYFFETTADNGLRVLFNNDHSVFLVIEQPSGHEFPFIKWMHELQNLIEDKSTQRALSLPSGSARIIPVM